MVPFKTVYQACTEKKAKKSENRVTKLNSDENTAEQGNQRMEVSIILNSIYDYYDQQKI
jgi:hypothetical protein